MKRHVRHGLNTLKTSFNSSLNLSSDNRHQGKLLLKEKKVKKVKLKLNNKKLPLKLSPRAVKEMLKAISLRTASKRKLNPK